MRNKRNKRIFRTKQRAGAWRRRGKGGMGEKGAEKLKHEDKKELRHCALSRSDVRIEPLSERGGRIEEEDFLRDLTNDQNLEGDERDKVWKKRDLDFLREEEIELRINRMKGEKEKEVF